MLTFFITYGGSLLGFECRREYNIPRRIYAQKEEKEKEENVGDVKFSGHKIGDPIRRLTCIRDIQFKITGCTCFRFQV